MDPENQGQEAEPSLRDTIDAAVIEVEGGPEKESTPAEQPAEQQGGEEAPESQVVDLNKPDQATKLVPGVKGAPDLEPAPKSWKATAQKAWSALPAEVRTEVQRREKEIARVFGETNQIREQVKQFNEIVRPYEARIRSTGLTSFQAAQELFKADHILSSAPTVARAQYMATLIKEYGVDIRALDDALSGQQGSTVDPVMSQVDKLLTERLSPLQQFISQQQQVAQNQEAQLQQAAHASIDQMSQDDTKYPYFQQVREDMADIIEMNARRQVYLTPEQAYTRAVAMNPEWGAKQAQLANNGRQLQQARQTNDRAQRALNASGSVSGAPGGSPVGGVDSNSSLRDTIEAAFSQVAGR